MNAAATAGGYLFIANWNAKDDWNPARGDVVIVTLRANGRLELGFQWLMKREPFVAPEKRLEILRLLRDSSTISIEDDKIDKRPSLPWSDFVSPENRRALFRTISWISAQLESREGAPT